MGCPFKAGDVTTGKGSAIVPGGWCETTEPPSLLHIPWWLRAGTEWVIGNQLLQLAVSQHSLTLSLSPLFRGLDDYGTVSQCCGLWRVRCASFLQVQLFTGDSVERQVISVGVCVLVILTSLFLRGLTTGPYDVYTALVLFVQREASGSVLNAEFLKGFYNSVGCFCFLFCSLVYMFIRFLCVFNSPFFPPLFLLVFIYLFIFYVIIHKKSKERSTNCRCKITRCINRRTYLSAV